MAETIEPPPSAPWILGGVSMGGMIAYEMARHRKPDAVVLIASCRTRQSLRHGFHARRTVVPWLPVGIWSVAKWLAPSVLAGSRRYDAAAQSRLVRMFQEMDSAFMHWALSAILGWNPTLLAGVRVFQIHGGRDLMIPARSVDADTLIADGGHMINLTHAEEVNAFIAKAAACACVGNLDDHHHRRTCWSGKEHGGPGAGPAAGLLFLDTGAMYRAVALAGLRRGLDWDVPDDLARLARKLDLRIAGERTYLDGEDVTEAVRTSEVTAVTRYAADNPQVRDHLVRLQRQLAGRRTSSRKDGTKEPWCSPAPSAKSSSRPAPRNAPGGGCVT